MHHDSKKNHSVKYRIIKKESPSPSSSRQTPHNQSIFFKPQKKLPLHHHYCHTLQSTPSKIQKACPNKHDALIFISLV